VFIFVLFGTTFFKKALGYVVSNRIGMKFGMNVSSSKYASIDGVGFLTWAPFFQDGGR